MQKPTANSLLESFKALLVRWEERLNLLGQSFRPLLSRLSELASQLETYNSAFASLLARQEQFETQLKEMPSKQELQQLNEYKETTRLNTERMNAYITELGFLRSEYYQLRQEYQALRETLENRR